MQAEDFKKYSSDFEKKLEHLVIKDVSTALYCRKYLTHLLQHKKYYLAIYADVLQKLTGYLPANKTNISLVDYGAGNGLLGIFAKFCGFKKVFINDLDAKFVQASQNLACQLNIEMDGYITGDITAVQAYFNNEAPDAIAGTDVIEHIYNLEDFFTCIQQLNQSMVTVFTTASNPKNFLKVRTLKKLQIKDELQGGTQDDHLLFGETAMQPFLILREQIIRRQTNSLADSEVKMLADITRGKNENDIINSVKQYCLTGELPASPTDKTNTCDPFSGSWTERILSLKTYSMLYKSAGFKPVFYNGFYNTYEPGLKKYLKKILNVTIAIAGNLVSPYIIIVGKDKKRDNF